MDSREYESTRRQYVEEAKQRWGDTDAYKEYQQKDTTAALADGLMAVFGEVAACKKCGKNADSATAQRLVKKLQDYITTHFYTCTKEILAGLGQMYVSDERFKSNIDRYGVGTAAFAAAAIEKYCD